jgi:hypothetical protein
VIILSGPHHTSLPAYPPPTNLNQPPNHHRNCYHHPTTTTATTTTPTTTTRPLPPVPSAISSSRHPSSCLLHLRPNACCPRCDSAPPTDPLFPSHAPRSSVRETPSHIAPVFTSRCHHSQLPSSPLNFVPITAICSALTCNHGRRGNYVADLEIHTVRAPPFAHAVYFGLVVSRTPPCQPLPASLHKLTFFADASEIREMWRTSQKVRDGELLGLLNGFGEAVRAGLGMALTVACCS